MPERLERTAAVLAGAWIALAMLFYCVRHAAVLYRTHQAGFETFFASIGRFFGAG